MSSLSTYSRISTLNISNFSYYFTNYGVAATPMTLAINDNDPNHKQQTTNNHGPQSPSSFLRRLRWLGLWCPTTWKIECLWGAVCWMHELLHMVEPINSADLEKNFHNGIAATCEKELHKSCANGSSKRRMAQRYNMLYCIHLVYHPSTR